MPYIVSFSGGKDSTCMLLEMLERGMQVDDIVFCDAEMEFEEMYEHIDNVERYIGRKITRLKADKNFNYYFGEHEKTKGKNKGSLGYGWPDMRIRWCTTLLKRDIFNKYLNSKGNKELIKCIGIAADEPKRIKDNGEKYPLAEWGITELEALQYRYDKGFEWGGLYRLFKRVSCWCCPLKGLGELYVLYTHYPKYWARLLEMDKKSSRSFRSDYTLQQLDIRFAKQSRQVEMLL